MYDGYLVKIGNTVVPNEYILEKTYKVSPNKRQDLDPFRDADGILHRNVIGHRPSTVQFQLRRPTSTLLNILNSIISGGYLDEAERKVALTYYCPDIDSYQSGEFYIPNPEYTIDYIHEGIIYYDYFTVEFIEY